LDNAGKPLDTTESGQPLPAGGKGLTLCVFLFSLLVPEHMYGQNYALPLRSVVAGVNLLMSESLRQSLYFCLEKKYRIENFKAIMRGLLSSTHIRHSYNLGKAVN